MITWQYYIAEPWTLARLLCLHKTTCSHGIFCDLLWRNKIVSRGALLRSFSVHEWSPYNVYSRVWEGDELIMTRYRERSARHSFNSQSSIWETIGPFVVQERTTPSRSYQQWLSGGRHNVMVYSCSSGLLQISMKHQWRRKKKKKVHSWDEQWWGVSCRMLRVMSMREYVCPPDVPLPLCRN